LGHKPFSRVILIVLDSVGVGELPDAHLFGDEGSNTLLHIAESVGLHLPNLARLGLGNIIPLPGVPPEREPIAAYGKMAELAPGKDTTSGHWEMVGIELKKPFTTYPSGFPRRVIEEFEERIGRRVLGNFPASGTVIIEEIGEIHLKTGFPIIYTSADSVFQIAAHEEVIPVPELYEMCREARKILRGDDEVVRVIARPFIGKPGSFRRTERREDFSIAPPEPNLLGLLSKAGFPVVGVGKIKDIFAGCGITKAVHTGNNREGMEAVLKVMEEVDRGLIFTNLVDFDVLYGHRNDPRGYAKALEEFVAFLPRLEERKEEGDLLVITADHGCERTTESTDHSREYVPLLIWGERVKQGVNLGVRRSFADLGQTIAENFGLTPLPLGESFLSKVI